MEEPLMTELTPDQVRALAAAAGLPLDGADLAEVTHRLNAFVDVLGGLATLDLTGAEPAPTSPPGPTRDPPRDLR
jgi:Asp-tRNA(Asn)/Glu-tRNA(Gln) amidotransferase C subunit